MVSSKLVIPCGACERALQEVVTVAIGRLAMFTVIRIATEQTLENITRQGAPPWMWPRHELAVDVPHDAVDSFATAASRRSAGNPAALAPGPLGRSGPVRPSQDSPGAPDRPSWIRSSGPLVLVGTTVKPPFVSYRT